MELLIYGIVLFGFAYSWLSDKNSWKELADELDLVDTSSVFGNKKLQGHLRGFDVSVEAVSENNRIKKILLKVADVNRTFTLGRDSAFQRMIKPDIETGDQLFDERTRIEGDEDWALALLGHDARRLLEMMVTGWDGELQGGTLSATSKEFRDVPSTLDTLLDIAHLLQLPPYAELPKLLMERACHDPSYTVRFQVFRRLTRVPAFKEEAATAAEILIESSSALLKLEAGRHLLKSSPEQSDRAAQELIALATLKSADSSIRRSAIEALADSDHQASAVPAMGRILEGPDATLVRAAAIEGLVRSGAKAELLNLEVDDETEAEVLARGLGRFDATVQPKLLQLLSHPGDGVRLLAVRSLDQVGDIQAVGALRKLAGQDRLFKSAVAREAERVIENIKSRSAGSQQGELSIVTVAPLEGAVSPVGDSEAGGEVSLS